MLSLGDTDDLLKRTRSTLLRLIMRRLPRRRRPGLLPANLRVLSLHPTPSKFSCMGWKKNNNDIGQATDDEEACSFALFVTCRS